MRSAGIPKRLIRRTSPWQRPQVSGTLFAKTLDSGFFGRMIEWLVWQSVQTGAAVTPRSTALPWTLVLYSAACLSWHMPQVSGLPFLNSSVLVETMSWVEPWQVSQFGADSLPFLISPPCTLCQKF